MIKIYKPADILNFGKNKGYSLSEIYQYEPNYIEYLIINSLDFVIDIDSFSKLPNPTPLSIGHVCGTEARQKIMNSKASLLSKIQLADNTNMRTNVEEIKKLAELGVIKLVKVNFEFSDEAKEKNEMKINLKM